MAVFIEISAQLTADESAAALVTTIVGKQDVLVSATTIKAALTKHC